jgi:predicted transcriptional regulator
MSAYTVEIFNDNGDLIQTEQYKKLTDISKKYAIPYATLYNVVDQRCLTKSRLSNKTKLLMKKMKVSTTINEVLKNIGVPEIEIIVDKEIIDNYV